MGFFKRQTWIYGLILLTFILLHVLKVNSISDWTPYEQEESYHTNLDINSALLSFEILQNGQYRCDFTLDVTGNEDTARGVSRGQFLVPDIFVNWTYLLFQEKQVTPTISIDDYNSICTFQSDLELPIGVRGSLTGSFRGKCQTNTTSLYTYQLGIDWGNIIGNQRTLVELDGRKMVPLDPILPEVQVRPVKYEIDYHRIRFECTDIACSGFYGTLEVFDMTTQPSLLKVGLTNWNAKTGQSIEIPIQNIGSFNISIQIRTPIWIECNVTEKFSLAPAEIRTLIFRINSYAISGLKDTITIVIKGSIELYPIDEITIQVSIGDERVFDSIINLLFLFILPLTICFGIVVILYNQRSKIYQFIKNISYQIQIPHNSRDESFKSELPDGKTSRSRDLSWELTKRRWEPILPEKELKILEILIIHGSMNQQELTEHLGVSKGTVSRLISRLESKRLLYRERMGMSNIIKLNKKRL